MKKYLTLLIIALSFNAISQTTADVFEYKAITFYGLDFTSAKCIGSTEFPSGEEMIDIYFKEWNNLFIVGDDRLRIGKPYKKKIVDYDTSIFALNREINPTELIIDDPYTLQRSDIARITNKYANPKSAGIGMVYIVESLNAKEKYVSIWITFFKNSTGEVLLSEPLRSKGKGRKFDYFWESAIVRLFVDSAYDYKSWKKIYK